MNTTIIYHDSGYGRKYVDVRVPTLAGVVILFLVGLVLLISFSNFGLFRRSVRRSSDGSPFRRKH